MCLFNSSPKTPAPTPPPARSPATLDVSNLEQKPSSSRKKLAKGKRGIRNTGSSGLGIGGDGIGNNALGIPSKSGGNK
tara:strand:- start:718 stop:951 length:234 start_codon:yes stop_codon:yes gene_type:complete